MTNRSTILGLLAERRQEITARFGVKRFAQFGSAARDELDMTSDVDVLVEHQPRFFEFLSAQPVGVRRHLPPTWTSSSTSDATLRNLELIGEGARHGNSRNGAGCSLASVGCREKLPD